MVQKKHIAGDRAGTKDRPIPEQHVESLEAEESRTNPRTVSLSVPSDHPTVSDTIEEIRSRRTPPGIDFEVTIESGHTVASLIEIRSDMSHVTITSADNTVPVDTSLSTAAYDGLINVVDGRSPVLDTVLDIQGNADLSVGFALRRSEGYITQGSGVTNGADRCISATDGSLLWARGAVATNGNNRGVSINRSSGAFLRDADMSGNGERALRVSAGSFVSAQDSDLRNSGGRALFADAPSLTDISRADISGSEFGLALTDGAIVKAPDLTGNNITDFAARVADGATLILDGASFDSINASYNNYGMLIYGSEVRAPNISVTNSPGLFLERRANADFNGGTIDQTSSNAVYFNTGSEANLEGCTTASSTAGDPHEGDIDTTFNTLSGQGIAYAENFEQ